MIPRRWRGWLVIALLLSGAGVYVWQRGSEPANGAEVTADVDATIPRVVPDSLRIRVEVLNGAGTRGLARRATRAMRDAGFDVVASGNAPERTDSSIVLVRSGQVAWGELAAQALQGARVELRPDTSRYLDLTIIIGARWRPPPEAFDP
ncbi:MAG: hypothetical protein RLZZ63_1280 [Gemmatimonadota bacterium]|jgi:hypothetical protein